MKGELELQDKANLDVSGEVICVVGHISVNQGCKFNAEITYTGDADITREQMAKLLYGYTMYKKWDTSSETDLAAYSDAGSISGYAVEPMKWAVKNGIISGMTANTLEPQGKLTRAQMATVLERYTKKFVK